MIYAILPIVTCVSIMIGFGLSSLRKIKMEEKMESEKKVKNRPDFITDEHLEYLDNLRAGGEVNMFGATKYALKEFPDLSKDQARAVLAYWMTTFGGDR